MKKRTRGIIAFILGVIGVLGNAALIVLNLAFKYDFDGRNNIITNAIILIIGVYLCYLGIKMIKKSNDS